jgi:hypothetical protein
MLAIASVRGHHDLENYLAWNYRGICFDSLGVVVRSPPIFTDAKPA